MKKIRIISALLALLIVLSVPVFANNAETTAEPKKDLAEIKVDDLVRFYPDASLGDIAGENAKLPTAFLFDSSSETKLNVTVSPIESFDVRTSASVSKALGAFGVVVGGESGTTIDIEVHATNDPLSNEWTQLFLEVGGPEKIGELNVFRIADEYIDQYCYYKFVFTAEGCGDISISEIAMFASTEHGPELEWDSNYDPPKLVPVGTVGKAEQKKSNRIFMFNRFLSLIK